MSNKRTFLRRPRALGTGVLVQLIPPETVSSGGIVIATGNEVNREAEATTEAYIVSAGAEAFKNWQNEVPPKINDRVLIAKYAGHNVPNLDAEGNKYREISEADIGMIFEGEEYVGE